MIFSGFIFGLLSSLHCLGMCGPLVLSLPSGGGNFFQQLKVFLTYHSGRILTYIALGLIAGLLGSIFSLSGYQQKLSIITGALLIVVGTLQLLHKTGNISNTFDRFSNKLSSGVRTLFGKNIPKEGIGKFLMLGIINGFLPCGVVYLSLSGAVVTGNPADAMLYMFFFGLGTLATLLPLPFFKSFLMQKMKWSFNRVLPIIVLIMGFWFVLRGSNIGIPYLSPQISAAEEKASCCHKE